VGKVALEMQRKARGSSAPAAGSAGAAGRPADPFAQREMLPGIRHCVAVASAKGGVGKSTVATNLALALARRGMRVGLMDADIYGPSLPIMMGADQQPTITADRKIVPLEKDGLKLMSIGFLVPPDRAMIWRGPMVMAAVTQFLGDVLWGELDVLVVDLPPGTGDAQLTLVQKVPLSGVVIVTTPQDVALLDVVRGIQMFEETRAPVIGVVENMSGFVCSHCGHETPIFGKGGGKRTSDRYGVPFLGAVPIEPLVRECGDAGRPVVASHPDSVSARAFREVADSVERFLNAKAGSVSAR
jgi:ATP-binding protein involved in chromosome partitioning